MLADESLTCGCSFRYLPVQNAIVPVINYAPRHEDVWGAEVKSHLFLVLAFDEGTGLC
jgi:hypothetical protein